MILLISLASVLIINFVLFLVAYAKQSDRLTDFAYALSFIVVALTALLASSERSSLKMLAVSMVIVWALRLGIFLVIRVWKSGKDARFDGIRNNFWKFMQFWLSQGIVAWVLLLPLLLMRGTAPAWLVVIGVAIWVVGMTIESIADLQKYRFKQDARHDQKWIESGTWKWSRHPNYFGEMLIWIGMYVTLVGALDGWWKIVALISPLTISIMLRFISGVPPLEKSANKRWGNDKQYQAYKRRTSLLVPLPPKH